MPDFRCYCDPHSVDGNTIHLSKEESHHLVGTSRARQGCSVTAFDGRGNEWETILQNNNRNAATLSIRSHTQAPRPTARIALAQALPKGKLLDSIIKKATEIGAGDLYPLITERTEIKLSSKREESKTAKWKTAAIEAAKQSGNPYPVEIHPITTLDAFLCEAANAYPLRLIASLTDKAQPLGEHLREARTAAGDTGLQGALWLVGPEGDFTEKETEQAISAGFLPTYLGPHVMRCETAATYALSVISYELDPARSGAK